MLENLLSKARTHQGEVCFEALTKSCEYLVKPGGCWGNRTDLLGELKVASEDICQSLCTALAHCVGYNFQ